MWNAHDPVWLAALASAMACTGLVSGLLAGLLGVGGGIVVVPVLFNAFPLFGLDPSILMKVSVGTSLATIIPTSIISARNHYAKGAMDMSLLRSLAPSIALGVLLGVVLAIWLKGQALSAVFGSVALAVALQMGLTGIDFRLRDGLPGGRIRDAIGLFIGAISAMMGIGGGTVGVPLLSMLGSPIRAAVATSSAFGLIISIPAALGMIYGGWDNTLLPPLSLGYVNLIGFALIAPSSILSAPWGVKLAHTIPPLLLKKSFALFLFVTSVRMLYGLLH
jgi:uncharacterized membrane protein YfcA